MTVVIHAPPRVGGHSIRMFLSDELNIPTFHVHYLLNDYYYANKRDVKRRIERHDVKSYKIVSLVRDPIARNLSEYWRRLFMDRNGYKDASKVREEQGLTWRPGTHREKFFAFVDHYRQHCFFGSELKFWNVNPYEETFEPPYMIYDDRVLLIRTEDLTQFGRQALTDLLGIDYEPLPFWKKNVVPVDRERIDLTEAYVDAMYQKPYFPSHFYSEEEIERMKNKWMTLTPQP